MTRVGLFQRNSNWPALKRLMFSNTLEVAAFPVRHLGATSLGRRRMAWKAPGFFLMAAGIMSLRIWEKAGVVSLGSQFRVSGEENILSGSRVARNSKFHSKGAGEEEGLSLPRYCSNTGLALFLYLMPWFWTSSGIVMAYLFSAAALSSLRSFWYVLRHDLWFWVNQPPHMRQVKRLVPRFSVLGSTMADRDSGGSCLMRSHL